MSLKAGYTGIKKFSEQFNLTSEGTLSLNVENDPDAGGSLPISGDAAKILAERDAATRQLIDDTVGWESINLVDDNKYAVSNVTRSVVENGIKVLASNASSSNADIRFRNNASNTQPYLVANKRYKISVNIVAVSGTSTAAIAFRNSTGQILSSKAIAGTGKFELTYTPSVDVYVSIFVRMGNTGATGTEYIIYKDLMVCDAIYKDFDYQPYHATVEDSLAEKCDNSVIAPVENGTTVQKSDGYAVGSHAIRNGAFITWKNAKAQGETINDASDYDSGDVADYLETLTASATEIADTNVTLDATFKTFLCRNKVVNFWVRFTVTANLSSGFHNLFDVPYIPVLSSTYFKIFNKNSPYEDVAVGFILNSKMAINQSLNAGTYEIQGTYICQ